MTTKLTVALWKWENGCVKERWKSEKGVFLFSFSGVWIDREMSNYTSPLPHFTRIPWIQTAPTRKPIKPANTTQTLQSSYAPFMCGFEDQNSDKNNKVVKLRVILCLHKLLWNYITIAITYEARTRAQGLSCRVRVGHGHAPDTVNPCLRWVNSFDHPDTIKLSMDTARTRFGQSFVPVYFVFILLQVKQFNFKKKVRLFTTVLYDFTEF